MKYFLYSKTVWFNIITFVLAVIAIPQFISLVPAGALPYIALVSAVGNLILRMFFQQPPLTTNLSKAQS